MAATIWKGYLSFGMVSVPVHLAAAARPEKVEFHMVNPDTGSRIRQKTVDASNGKEIKRSHLVKAAELDDGRTVYLTNEDLETILPASSKSMEVLEFVRLEQVDPVYFDASYYLLPEGEGGAKPYYVLLRALEKMEYAAVAKMIRARREYLVLIRPSRGGLTLHTLFYEDEVRDVDGYGEDEDVSVDSKEVELACKFIEAMASDFEPEKYHDSYREAVYELLEAKAKGQTLVSPEAPVAEPTSDLMAALKASLKMRQQNGASRMASKDDVKKTGARAAKSKAKTRTKPAGRSKATGSKTRERPKKKAG